MPEKEIKKGNELIAKYMGFELSELHDSFYETYYRLPDPYRTFMLRSHHPYLEFYNSWEWLMPVVEKIMFTKIGDGFISIDYPYLRTFGMKNKETGYPMVRFNGCAVYEAPTLKEAMFIAVVEFIKSETYVTKNKQ